MDHRAISDAEEINAIGGAPLRHVGEMISPEMQMPKLRWLQREMPDRFARAAHLWDLPDWLVWRACGQPGAFALLAGLQVDLSRPSRP